MSDRYQSIYTEAVQKANQGAYGDAGRTILERLGVSPSQVSRLDGQGKKLAFLAANYLAKAGDAEGAVEIYLALGEKEKGAALLERTGDLLAAQKVRSGYGLERVSISRQTKSAVGGAAVSKYTAQRLEKEGKLEAAAKAYVQVRLFGDAARLLKKTGQIEQAANCYAEGGLAFEAAQCYITLGDTGKALENLARVPRDAPNYREAAVKAVLLTAESGSISFQLDSFLGEFLRTGPRDNRELEAFYLLAKLYENNNMLGNAKDLFEKVERVKPNYRDVSERLAKVARFSDPSSAVYERIRAQEASFRGEKRRIDPAAVLPPAQGVVMPDLPPAPDLPGLSAGGPKTILGAAGVQAAGVPRSRAKGAQTASEGPVSCDELFAVGSEVVGRYRIIAEVGRGGMAAVYRAEDKDLDEEIALKVFLTQINDPEIMAQSENRFKQELKLSRKLAHKNIIRLYDIGLHQGYRYISMELLQGEDLEHKLSPEGTIFDYAAGIGLMMQACAGLYAAHEQGVVHRDIKPENLFVGDNGVLKVMDFGIAKNTVKPGMTVEGMLAGTPHYIAPEQISNFSKVTQSADLYSLGVTMYRMFAGQLPFDNDDMTKLLMMHMTQNPRPIEELNPKVPPLLGKLVMNLLQKDPANRLPDARAVAVQLKAAYASLG